MFLLLLFFSYYLLMCYVLCVLCRCDPDGLFTMLLQESGDEDEIMEMVSMGMDGDDVNCEL